MNEEARLWLEEQECIVSTKDLSIIYSYVFYIFGMQEDRNKFEEHGYWNLSYVASMTQQVDFHSLMCMHVQ